MLSFKLIQHSQLKLPPAEFLKESLKEGRCLIVEYTKELEGWGELQL